MLTANSQKHLFVSEMKSTCSLICTMWEHAGVIASAKTKKDWVVFTKLLPISCFDTKVKKKIHSRICISVLDMTSKECIT